MKEYILKIETQASLVIESWERDDIGRREREGEGEAE